MFGRLAEVGGDAFEQFDERLTVDFGKVAERALADGIEPAREDLSHSAALPRKGDQHAASISGIGLTLQQPGRFHPSCHSYRCRNLDLHPPGQLSRGERLFGA